MALLRVFIPEGEPCADAMRDLGLEAIATLGGCNGFNPIVMVATSTRGRCCAGPRQVRGEVRPQAAAYPVRWLRPIPAG